MVPTNYHFTTTLEHIQLCGDKVLEIFTSEAMKVKCSFPFKGNPDIEKLEKAVRDYGK